MSSQSVETDDPILDYSTPAEQANISRVQDYFREVVNGRATDRADEYFSTGFTQHNTLLGEGTGGLRDFLHDFFFKTFPDLTASADIAIAQNDRVVSFTTWRGHAPEHDGDELTIKIADLFRFADGKIVEHWDLWDYLELEQYGIERPPHDQPDAGWERKGTEEQIRNLDHVLRFMDEITVQDTSRAPLYMAKDFIQHDPMIAPGVEGFQQCCEIFRVLAPDMKLYPHHIVAGKNHIGAFWDMNGTQAGKNVPFILPTADGYRLADDMLVEHWDVMDYTFVKESLGFHPKSVMLAQS